MDEFLPTLRNLNSPKISQNLGGLKPVDGWFIRHPGDFRNFIEEGLNPDTKVHISFNSKQEIVDFMRGEGVYSDRNSFFINSDMRQQREEGFFGEMYCDNCIDDFVESLSSADNPLDVDELDASITVYQETYETDSFRPGYDKFVEELRYECVDHSEVSLSLKDSWYEEN